MQRDVFDNIITMSWLTCLMACWTFSKLMSLASFSSVFSSILSMDTLYWHSSTTTTSGWTARIVWNRVHSIKTAFDQSVDLMLVHKKRKTVLTVATSFLLLSLKWAVPTRYKILPSGVVRRVTVSGRSGSVCRRWVRICHNTSTASESAK